MKPVIVRPYSSLFETPRVQLSREAFENSGIGVFSSEKIPFADRTGPTFAQNLTKLLVTRVEDLQKKDQSFPDGIHIYELGAGTGILAKRILDLLKNQHAAIYKKIILHLSDISKPMVSEIKSSNVFKNHKGHIVFEVIDATNPKFKHKPLFVYFTNLIDSLPYHRQILVKDGQIFEFQIQTSIKKDAQIIDATSYPPKVLEEKDIAKLLSSSDLNRRLILTPQILPVLEEEGKFVPIDEVLNMGQEELEDLKKLAQFQNKDKPFVFNYSYTARTALRKMIQVLKDGGFIFFSDFGFTLGGYEQVLYLRCESVIFFSVDFPSFKQVAETAGKTCYLTSNPQGFAQEMLIDTLLNDERMGGLFRKESVEDLRGQVSDFLENVKTILSKNSEGKDQQSEKVNHLYNSLTEETRYDYRLLTNLAFLLLQAGFYKETDFYANILPEKYGHSVGITYHLIKGKTEQELGNLKVAEKFFRGAVAVEGKRGFLAYLYLGELYKQEKRYQEYIEVIKNYLKYTRRGDHLMAILSIAWAEEKLYDPKTARKTLEDLVRIGRRLKTLSAKEREALKQAELRLVS